MKKLIALLVAVIILLLVAIGYLYSKPTTVNYVECDTFDLFELLASEVSQVDTLDSSNFVAELVLQPATDQLYTQVVLDLIRSKYDMIENSTEYSVFEYRVNGEATIYVYVNAPNHEL